MSSWGNEKEGLLRYLLTLFAITLVAGCSALRPADSAREIAGEQWQLDGKLGVWYRDERESANVRWLNCGERYRIQLSGPLGSSTAIIEGDERTVTLKRSGEAPISAATPEELAGELGWPLPVSALQHWVRGRPVPLQPFGGETDRGGHLTNLQQLGWVLDFARYTSPAIASPPRLVELHNENLRMKLLIRQWRDNPGDCGPGEEA